MYGEPKSCRMCGEYFSMERRPVILLGCGHSICSTPCAEKLTQAHGSDRTFNVLMCPTCHLETFLPVDPKMQHQVIQANTVVQPPPSLLSGASATSQANREQQQPPNRTFAAAFVAMQLPTAYHLLPATNNNNSNLNSQPIPLCETHPGMPRGYYCPSHAAAVCVRCMTESHSNCPYRACELREAKPILLQGLNQTRRTLENSRERCSETKQQLTQQQLVVANNLFEEHCEQITTWMERCMQVGYAALADANTTHKNRVAEILRRVSAVGDAEQQIDGALRALDCADSLPAASLVDAMPILKKTVRVPEAAMPEGEYRGIDPALLPPPVSKTVLPRLDAVHGERLLVADQGDEFIAALGFEVQKHQERSQFISNPVDGYAEKMRLNEQTNAAIASRGSLVLVDVESRNVVCKLLENEIKSPNGIVEVITEIEVEDRSAAAGILLLRDSSVAASGLGDNNNRNSVGGEVSSPERAAAATAAGERNNADNFMRIQIQAAFDAERQQQQQQEQQQSNAGNRRPETTVTAESDDDDEDRSDVTGASESRRKKQQQQQSQNQQQQQQQPTRRTTMQLRREFAICDTLNHRIIFIDATTGEITREIYHPHRGTCINEFSPFAIAVVPVPTYAEEQRIQRREEEKKRKEREEQRLQQARMSLQKERQQEQQQQQQRHSRQPSGQHTGGELDDFSAIGRSVSQQSNQQQQPQHQLGTDAFYLDTLQRGHDAVASEQQQQQQSPQQQNENHDDDDDRNPKTKCGALLVTDVDNHRVYLIDAETGHFLRHWGNFRGSAIDEFWSPLGVCHIRDTLFAICDSANHRIVVISIGHSGFLFTIDLFNNFSGTGNNSSSAFSASLLDFQRMFPSSVCTVSDGCRSVTDEVNKDVTHETVQLAVACKMPASHRASDCVILVDFSFDLKRVEKANERPAMFAGPENAAAQHPHLLRNQQQQLQSQQSQQQFRDPVFSLTRTEVDGGVAGLPQQQRARILEHRAASPKELLARQAISSSSSAVSYQLSKMRSLPPRTIFEAPVRHSGSTTTTTPLSPYASSPLRVNSTGTTGRHSEAVFDMLNAEWARSHSVLPRLNAQCAVAPCSLTVTTMKAALSSLQRSHQAHRTAQQQQQNNASPSSNSWTDNLFSPGNNSPRREFGRQDSSSMSTEERKRLAEFQTAASASTSTVSLVVTDRVNRCVWTLDPATGRLHDRVDGRVVANNNNKNNTNSSSSSSNPLFFGSPTFAARVSSSVTIAPLLSKEEKEQWRVANGLNNCNACEAEQQQQQQQQQEAREQQEQARSPVFAGRAPSAVMQDSLLIIPDTPPDAYLKQPPSSSSRQQQQQQSQPKPALPIPIPGGGSGSRSGAAATAPPPPLPIRVPQAQQQQQPQAPAIKSPPRRPTTMEQLQQQVTQQPPKPPINPTKLPLRERLYRYYLRYNPDAIFSLESTLTLFKPGKEEQLWQALVRKHGPEPTEADTSRILRSAPADPSRHLSPFANVLRSPTVAAQQATATTPLSPVAALPVSAVLQQQQQRTIDPTTIEPRERLLRFYMRYNVEKIAGIDATLRAYQGPEKQKLMWEALVKRYGAEPTEYDTNAIVPLSSATATAEDLNSRSNSSAVATTSQQQQQSLQREATLAAVPSSASSVAVPAAAVSAVAVPVPAPAAPRFDEVAYRQRIVDFYTKYNPAKLSAVDAALAAYPGPEGEKQLFEILNGKYVNVKQPQQQPVQQQQPAPAASTTAAAAVPTTARQLADSGFPAFDEQAYRARIRAFYLQQNLPAKATNESIDAAVASYPGADGEKQLFSILEEKYNPKKQQQPQQQELPAVAPPNNMPAENVEPQQQQQPQPQPTISAPTAIAAAPEIQPEQHVVDPVVRVEEPVALPAALTSTATTTAQPVEEQKQQPAEEQQQQQPIETAPPVEPVAVEAAPQEAAEEQPQQQQPETAKAEEEKPAEAPAAPATSTEAVNPHKQRLTEFYAKHNPEKIESVDKTLAEWKGKEEQLFKILTDKYEKPAAKPAAKQPATAAAAKKVAAANAPPGGKSPAPKPAAKPDPKPATAEAAKPAPKPDPKPAATDTAAAKPDPKPATAEAAKPAPKPEAKPAAVAETKPVAPATAAEEKKLDAEVPKAATPPATTPATTTAAAASASATPDEEKKAAPPAVTAAASPKKVSPKPAGAANAPPGKIDNKINKAAPKAVSPKPAAKPPAAKPAAATGTATAADHKKRLTEFYSKHNPEKLDSVDKTLAEWKGKEEKLFAALEKKYSEAK